MIPGGGGWRRYDDTLFPVFHERFEEKWGEGAAPFLDPSVYDKDQPRPRAQWTTPSPSSPYGRTAPRPQRGYIEALADGTGEDEQAIALRNGSFKKAVAHAEEFIYGP